MIVRKIRRVHALPRSSKMAEFQDDSIADATQPLSMEEGQQVPQQNDEQLSESVPAKAHVPMVWKRSRLRHNVEEPPSQDLAEAARKIEELREINRQRSEKWGVPYTEPGTAALATAGITKTEFLRLAKQTTPGEVTGFDPTAPEYDEKRAARAKRFEIPVFSYEDERLAMAGLTPDEIRLRKERRARAARFGPDKLDIQIAQAAHIALGEEPTYLAPPLQDAAQAQGGEGEGAGAAAEGSNEMVEGSSAPAVAQEAFTPAPRPKAIHMCAHLYLPAANNDILSFFAPIKPAFVEWLNGNSVNVLFEDEHTAKRALEIFSEPVPHVPGVPPVQDCWRVCLKPLIKLVMDKYAPAGAQTTVYMRQATELDTQQNAKTAYGPRVHGTFSKGGVFSMSRHHKEGDEDMGTALVPKLGAGNEDVTIDPFHAAGAVAGALRQMSSHIGSALDAPLPDRIVRPPPPPAVPMAAGGGATRTIEVVKPGSKKLQVNLQMPERHHPLDREAGQAPIVVVKRQQSAATGSAASAGAAAGAGAGACAGAGSQGGPVVIKRGRGSNRAGALLGSNLGAGAGGSRLGGRKRGREEYTEDSGLTVEQDEVLARAEAAAAEAGRRAGTEEEYEAARAAAAEADHSSSAGAGAGSQDVDVDLLATHPLGGSQSQSQSHSGEALLAGYAQIADEDI